jgi:hypothetical protein
MKEDSLARKQDSVDAAAARAPRRRVKARLPSPPPSPDAAGRDSRPERSNSWARIRAPRESEPSTQWAPPPPRTSKPRTRVVRSTRVPPADPVLGFPLRIAPVYLSADEARIAVDAAIAHAVGPLLVEIETLRRRLIDAEAALAAPPAPATPPSAVTAPSAPPFALAAPPASGDLAEPMVLDPAIDGTRRQRMALATLVCLLVALFGGLVGSLALD